MKSNLLKNFVGGLVILILFFLLLILVVPRSKKLNLETPVKNIVWHWISFSDPSGGYDVDVSENYTVEFGSDNNVSIKADCNFINTTYTMSEEGQLEINPIFATTLVLCPPGSRSDEFLKNLVDSRIYHRSNGDLFLDLKADGGTMRFYRNL